MQTKFIPLFLYVTCRFSNNFCKLVVVCNLFSMVSKSRGSEAANSIASTCLSNFVGEEGKSIILFFFFTFHL